MYPDDSQERCYCKTPIYNYEPWAEAVKIARADCEAYAKRMNVVVLRYTEEKGIELNDVDVVGWVKAWVAAETPFPERPFPLASAVAEASTPPVCG